MLALAQTNTVSHSRLSRNGTGSYVRRTYSYLCFRYFAAAARNYTIFDDNYADKSAQVANVELTGPQEMVTEIIDMTCCANL